jgi:hypothetical protein
MTDQNEDEVKDVRIFLCDGSIFHFPEAIIKYIPNIDNPKSINVKTRLMTLDINDYHSIDCIVRNWEDGAIRKNTFP